jgi:glycosyltransferase involved in cell wall biosynthesis
MAQLDHLKVAIAHYWLIQERGGEKVLRNLLELFPQADVYTLFYDANKMGEMLKGHRVYTSKLDHAWLRPHYTKCFPLYPQAVKSLSLKQNYDLLISSESGPIKGIRKPEHTKHLCYTHTPMRYCWGHTEEYTRNLPSYLKPLVTKAFGKLKDYDLTTIDNVDTYLANSNNVAERIKKYYHRDARVIHPPVENRAFSLPLTTKKRSDAYLSFGALVPYKRIDLLIEAFRNRQDNLVIVGEGSERKRLEAIASPNIHFTGALPWEAIAKLFQESKALLFPGEEDFGIIPLEAMANGCPVIAYSQGGALETVIWSGQAKSSTGLFFNEQSSASILSALEEFESISHQFNPTLLREHAQNFSQKRFQSEIKQEVDKILS